MMLLLLIFGTIFQLTHGVKAPVCKAVTYSGTLAAADENWNPVATLYSYNFKIKIAFDAENAAYPNIITVTNFQETSSNSSLYYRTTPLWFQYGFFWNVPNFSANFMYFNETWVISFPNGQISHYFNINYDNNSTERINDGNPVFLNEGIIFGGDQGFIMDQNNPCIDGTILNYDYGTQKRTLSQTICCTEYDYIEIPKFDDRNACEEFTSKTTITDNAHDFKLDLKAVFGIEADDFNTNISASIDITDVSISKYSYNLYLTNTLGFYHGQNRSTPQSDGIVHLYDSNDLQWDFIFNFDGNTSSKYYGVIVGEINRRQGKFLKNNYEPFTINNPCSTRSAGVPFSTASSTTSFCCTRFANDVIQTTTETITTTTKHPSSTDPKSNAIGSLCSNDTSQAWLDIVFVIDTSKAMSKRSLSQVVAEISTYMEDFSFAQYGDHTVRAAIIGYASDVTTYFELTDSTDYEGFVEALFDFADRGSSDDTGGNVQGALQQAYNLLISQKSSRRPLIVLTAAAYNPIGFQGADTTASIIKQNGVCIIVVNFATTQGVLATALQNISCDGYYYISNDSDINGKMTYALTQLNCICPPGSVQFRYYNTAWTNYTNYGDCLFGSNLAASPLPAQMACRPGVLAAVTSQQKLDFITDYVVPYEMPNSKKFTIGLHKSSDLQWKWWGYNKTEYPLGDFPSMLDTPSANDNYGYMWNHYGFNWTLQTGKNVPLPYICQARACDAEYICDQTQVKKFRQNLAAARRAAAVLRFNFY